MVNAVETTDWTNVIRALEESEQLLQATLDGDCEATLISLLLNSLNLARNHLEKKSCPIY